jgi:hypothetical protein
MVFNKYTKLVKKEKRLTKKYLLDKIKLEAKQKAIQDDIEKLLKYADKYIDDVKENTWETMRVLKAVFLQLEKAGFGKSKTGKKVWTALRAIKFAYKKVHKL